MFHRGHTPEAETGPPFPTRPLLHPEDFPGPRKTCDFPVSFIPGHQRNDGPENIHVVKHPYPRPRDIGEGADMPEPAFRITVEPVVPLRSQKTQEPFIGLDHRSTPVRRAVLTVFGLEPDPTRVLPSPPPSRAYWSASAIWEYLSFSGSSEYLSAVVASLR